MSEGVAQGKEQRYYVGLGRATDYLLRCKDCQKLVLLADLQKRGSCVCGNKRVTEITTLTPEEMAGIQNGPDFPYREQFLAEFTAVE